MNINLEVATETEVKRRIELVVKDAITRGQQDIERAIPSIVADLCIHVMKHVSMETFGSELRIKVDMGKKP